MQVLLNLPVQSRIIHGVSESTIRLQCNKEKRLRWSRAHAQLAHACTWHQTCKVQRTVPQATLPSLDAFEEKLHV